MSLKKNYIIGLIITIFSAILLGFYPTAVRFLYSNGVNFAPILFITMFTRAVIMSLDVAVKGKTIFSSKENIKQVVIIAFFQFTSVVGVFSALKFMQAPEAMIIIFSFPLVLALLSAWKKEEAISNMLWLSLLFSFIGLVLIIGIGIQLKTITIIGLFFAFIAMSSIVAKLFFIGKGVKNYNPSVFSAQIMWIAAIFSLLLWFIIGGELPQNFKTWSVLLGAGIILGIGASWGTFWGIKFLGSVRYSLILNLEPVTGTIVAAILLGEILTFTQYIGIAIIVLSIITYKISEILRISRLNP